ncbi:zinc ribbon domain-containing protein [bacterium]|nr:zinc ribbon domain-containing protein [bacterium]
MPDYDFYCEDCGHHFEKFFPIDSDRSDLKCPECSSKKIQRNFVSISMGNTKGSCTDCTSDSCDWCAGNGS